MSYLNSIPAGRWFKRVLWLGILANLGLAVPTILAPARMIEFTSLPPATPLVWPQFAALLLVLLSHGNGAQHQGTADQCCYKCFNLIISRSSSVIIRDSMRDWRSRD